MGLRALPFTAALVLGACSTGRQPAPSTTGPRTLRGYILVVPMRDLLDSTLAKLLRRRGFRVWPDVRGGRGPAAAPVSFTFRGARSGSGRSLAARFFDTRTRASPAGASPSPGTPPHGTPPPPHASAPAPRPQPPP